MIRRAALLARVSLIGGALIVGILPGAASASIGPSPITDGGALTAPTGTTIALSSIATGLSNPVLVVSPRDGTGRLFIVEQTGRIRIRSGGAVLANSFLNIATSISTGGERGLLGLAFHPSFKTNRKFYVNFTDRSGNTVVREYKASATSPNAVESGSGRTILRVTQPYANHNGGMLAFGPDGYLYIGMGDGGSAGDPGNRAQNVNTLLGKMLRINVNGSTSTRAYLTPSSNPYVGRTGLDEIWQRGLRNPWRFSFDRSTGALWIGDVGQGRYEEVDRATKTSSGPGRGINWGWRVMEGFACYSPSTGCSTSGKQRPLLAYSHSSGRCAVTGGYVYRGAAIPALRGYYVFGDYCSGEIWAVSAGAASPATRILLRNTSALISGFGEDAAGELYVVDLNGTVSKIVPG